MRVLTGRIERQIFRAGVVFGDCRARFNGVRGQPVVDGIERGDVMGVGERRIGRRLVADFPVVTKIVRHVVMDLRAAGRHGVGRRGDRRQFFVIDRDPFGRVLRLFQRLGNDQRHRVADMAHLAGGQHRMGRRLVRFAVLAGDAPAANQAANAAGVEIGFSPPRFGCHRSGLAILSNTKARNATRNIASDVRMTGHRSRTNLSI